MTRSNAGGDLQEQTNGPITGSAARPRAPRTRIHLAWAALAASFGIAGCLGGEEAAPIVLSPEGEAAPADIEPAAMRDSLGSALGAISTSLVRENAPADAELHLVARVEVQRDEMLEIYEPAPGQLLVSGAGAPAGKPILDAEKMNGMAVEDVWSLATHAAAMPPELRAALDRASERQHGETVRLQGEPGKATASSLDAARPAGPGALTTYGSGWCDTGYYTSGYGDCPSGWDFTVCLDDWWNGAYAYDYSGAYYVYTNVCPATGAVTLKVQSDHGGGGIWTVSQNTVRWWYQSDIGCIFDCIDVRADVQNASGDRFHFRFYSLN